LETGHLDLESNAREIVLSPNNGIKLSSDQTRLNVLGFSGVHLYDVTEDGGLSYNNYSPLPYNILEIVTDTAQLIPNPEDNFFFVYNQGETRFLLSNKVNTPPTIISPIDIELDSTNSQINLSDYVEDPNNDLLVHSIYAKPKGVESKIVGNELILSINRSTLTNNNINIPLAVFDQKTTIFTDVSVNINLSNIVPTSSNEEHNLEAGLPFNGQLIISDIDSDYVTASITTYPENGTFSWRDQQKGLYTYTPNEKYDGAERIEFTVSDAFSTSDVYEISLQVYYIERNIEAKDDFIVLDSNESIEVSPLTNDVFSNIQLDDVDIIIIVEPKHGRLNEEIKGVFNYVSDQNYVGLDSFEYEIKNKKYNLQSAAIVEFDVLNFPPVAVDDSYSVESEIEIIMNVWTNDYDSNGLSGAFNNAMSIEIVSSPSNGSAVIRGSRIKYTSSSQFSGVDSFLYRISDEYGDYSEPAKVSITVTLPTVPTKPSDNNKEKSGGSLYYLIFLMIIFFTNRNRNTRQEHCRG